MFYLKFSYYQTHYNKKQSLNDILNRSLSEKSGKPNMPIMFGSTSKITYPGAGVALVASSVENLEFFKNLVEFSGN